MVARIAGLGGADRRTEILRAKDEGTLDDRVTAAEATLSALGTEVDALPLGEVAYAQITTSSAAFTALTVISGLSVTFTAVAGRRYRFTFKFEQVMSVATDVFVFNLEDTVSTLSRFTFPTNTTSSTSHMVSYVSNSSISGSKTWRVNGARAAGSGNCVVGAGSTYPAYVLVEDIGTL